MVKNYFMIPNKNEENARGIKVFTRRNEYEKNGRETAIALGYFDGVHTGPRSVLEAAKKYAAQHNLAVAVFTFTFSEQGKVKGKKLLSQRQKHEKLGELGVEFCFEPPFEAFSSLTPEEFFNQMLREEYGAKAIFCGADFAFGKGRAGNPALLEKMCNEYAMHLSVLPVTLWNGEEVSSSRIRAALEQGDMDEANTLLGYPYEIDFPVVHGQKLGSTLGFPTLNQVFPPDRQAPAVGVYITAVVLDGKLWPSATGYGPRPTVNGLEITCETFIPGFSGDLYGQNVTVRFYKKIAEIQKFETPQILADAVQSWAKQALDYFK